MLTTAVLAIKSPTSSLLAADTVRYIQAYPFLFWREINILREILSENDFGYCTGKRYRDSQANELL